MRTCIFLWFLFIFDFLLRFALLLEVAPRSASLMSPSSVDIDKDSRVLLRKGSSTEFTSKGVESQAEIQQKLSKGVPTLEAFSSFHHFFDLTEDFFQWFLQWNEGLHGMSMRKWHVLLFKFTFFGRYFCDDSLKPSLARLSSEKLGKARLSLA